MNKIREDGNPISGKSTSGRPQPRELSSMTGTKAARAAQCRRKFLRFFPKGFRDETYLAWERDYKWETHQRWEETLNRNEFRCLLRKREYAEIATRAVRTEQRSRHSMIFSFEKMALRDAVKSQAGARIFAEGLYALLHDRGSDEARFVGWCEAVAALPRKQTRVNLYLDARF